MNQSAKQVPCADVAKIAEEEFGAFFGAVTELFGSEEARLSAEDWLRELECIPLDAASPREWRRITIDVSERLASRVSVRLEAESA